MLAARGDGIERGGVDDFLDAHDFGVEFLRGELQPVALADGEVAAAHPEQAGLEAVRLDGRVVLVRGDVAALDEDLLGERDADAFARDGDGLLRRAPHLDAGDDAGLVVRREDEGVADAQRAALDATRDDAALVEAIHILHGKAQRHVVDGLGRLEDVEHVGDAGAGIPRHGFEAGAGDIRAVARGDGHELPGFQADLRKEDFVFRDDVVEDLLAVIDEVHLVHRDDDLADAEQREEVAVPPRLLAHALVRSDEQHRRIGARRAGDHVLQELLVPRRVDDDVGTAGRLELDLRGVDRDVLLLLLEQRIEQEGVFKLHPLLAARRLDLLDLAVGQRLRVVEDAADERGLAVIDVADEDDAEALEIGGVGLRIADCGLRIGCGRHLRGREIFFFAILLLRSCLRDGRAVVIEETIIASISEPSAQSGWTRFAFTKPSSIKASIQYSVSSHSSSTMPSFAMKSARDRARAAAR